MRLPKNQLEPIMTNSENIIQFGPNAYAKPATALNILRETVMERELFDYAFKEYCKRWAFKHPSPSDFFRSMEDASAVDLDWFWRAWFYDIEPVDISLDSVFVFRADIPKAPLEKFETKRSRPEPEEFIHVSRQRNLANGMVFLVDKDTSLRDFYYYYKPATDTSSRRVNRYESNTPITDTDFAKFKDKYYYELHFSNKGGSVMPIIIEWTYEDSTKEVEYINAYIWRKNEKEVIKTFAKDKKVVGIKLDPYKETADIDERNNAWTKDLTPTSFDLFKAKTLGRGQYDDANPMKKALKGN
jgi:hypothetical protein